MSHEGEVKIRTVICTAFHIGALLPGKLGQLGDLLVRQALF